MTNTSITISVELVEKLIKEQFPQWAHLPVSPVPLSGIDNRTFRLGDQLLVRLPSAKKYAPQVQKEQTWLPLLAEHLTISIPEPIGLGVPTSGYPWHWSVYKWLEGQSLNTLLIAPSESIQLARDLAHFLQELHTIGTTNGPLPGLHNFWRGGNLSMYDRETRKALKELAGVIDTNAATIVWEQALSSSWQNKPVWVHGDLSSGNILIQNGKLSGIIDFGCMAMGDPACDLVVAWTLFSSDSQQLFKQRINVDAGTWSRARGWALWKALITLASCKDKTSKAALSQKRLIHHILYDATNRAP